MLEDAKMINVYMSDYIPRNLDDFVYMAKENNILKVSQMEILSNEEYNSYMEQMNDLY